MTKFEVGKKYYMTSACDHNCTWTYEVISRTAKTVILKSDSTEPSRFRISVWDDAEIVKPLGTYSMNPILSAKRKLMEYAKVYKRNGLNCVDLNGTYTYLPDDLSLVPGKWVDGEYYSEIVIVQTSV